MRHSAEPLYRSHAPALFSYLVRMTGDPDHAADVLQDTFHRLMERPPSDARNVRGWLFRVATNLLRDGERRAVRRLEALSTLHAERFLSDRPPAPDRRVMEAEAQDRARALLAALSTRDRAILLMREEGFTHREIAEAVGTTTGSVGTLIARALDKLTRTTATPASEEAQ